MKMLLSLIMVIFVTHSFATDPKTAYEMVLKGDAIMIDVREMSELKEGMIEKAAWFPKSQIKPGSDVLKDFREMTKDKKVFVYCEAGRRAEVCKEILKGEGIDAESLGGFRDLKNVLPVKSIYERLNDPLSNTEAFNRPQKR